MTDQLITDIEAAEILGLAVQTLRNWRHRGCGPNYIKLGRAVRYNTNDLRDFVEGRKIRLGMDRGRDE